MCFWVFSRVIFSVLAFFCFFLFSVFFVFLRLLKKMFKVAFTSGLNGFIYIYNGFHFCLDLFFVQSENTRRENKPPRFSGF